MRTTFLIGNGFDVHLGLKTKFSDFYDTYIEQNMNTEDEYIKRFCNSLIEEKNNNITYENWSDFEGAFPQYVTSFEEISTILEDFTEKFCEYLEKVDSNVQPNEEIIQQFNNFVFGEHGISSSRNGRIRASEDNFNFINFNYTHNLISLVTSWVGFHQKNNREFPVPDILHIHGTKNRGIIIGIDNLKQLNRKELQTAEAAELCVKFDENKLLGNDNTYQFKKMINESKLIITYGISFGISDEMYWDILRKWLLNSKDHKLVVYMYDPTKFEDIDHKHHYPAGKANAIDKIKGNFLREKFKIFAPSNTDLLSKIYIADSNSVLNFKMYEEPSVPNDNKEPQTI